jgi:drug/metabolite transporter (DMT)-like permease
VTDASAAGRPTAPGRLRAAGQPPAPGRGYEGGRLAVPALATAMVILLAAGWLLSGHLVDGVPALAVAAGRTAASFVAITFVAVLTPRVRPAARAAAGRGGTVLLLAFLGFFMYYSGTLLATSRIGASRVGLIVSLLPCITFVIGVAAFREPSTRRKILGTALAVASACGYAAADGATADGGVPGGGTATLISGVLLALGGTTTYALYGYIYRQRMSGLPPVAALPAVTGAGTVMLGAAAVLFVPLEGISRADWGGIAVLGAGLTAPVFLISHQLILRKGPLFTSAVALAVPFLVRMGEWVLGWAGPPGPSVVVLIMCCAAGVWLTVGGGRPQRADAAVADRDGVADPNEKTTGHGIREGTST